MKRNNKLKTVKALFSVIITVALLSTCILAYPETDTYVYDGPGVLGSDTMEEIKKISDNLYAEKGARIAVCAVTDTGDESVQDYAKNLFIDWKINNGVLLLLVTESDMYYAVQSTSVVEVLTNEKLSGILNEKLESNFASKLYSDGALAVAYELSSFLTQNLTSPLTTDASGSPDTEKSTLSIIFGIVLKIVIVVSVLLIAGYITLIILEKKNAEKRRRFLEEKRRRMARDGRGGYRPISGSQSAPARQQNHLYNNYNNNLSGYNQEANLQFPSSYPRYNSGKYDSNYYNQDNRPKSNSADASYFATRQFSIKNHSAKGNDFGNRYGGSTNRTENDNFVYPDPATFNNSPAGNGGKRKNLPPDYFNEDL